MNKTYRERPTQRNCKDDEIDWIEPEQWNDGTGTIWFCWPLTAEQQVWQQAMCHVCGRPAQYIGLASPFGEGKQYFYEGDCWCYWCFPRPHLTGEAQRLASHADWARLQTMDDCLTIVNRFDIETDDENIGDVLARLKDDIRHGIETVSRLIRVSDGG